ncbi:hypothetical protein DL765_009963 [Monosporascus sp. GIB2]|nr:hypothetical protein DL765_009963 [Monosporascus sp. GIB2]
MDQPPSSGQVSEVVAHLERVSMGQSSHEDIYADDLSVKVNCIRAIQRVRSYMVQSSKPARCMWLPRHDETKVLLGKFIANVSTSTTSCTTLHSRPSSTTSTGRSVVRRASSLTILCCFPASLPVRRECADALVDQGDARRAQCRTEQPRSRTGNHSAYFLQRVLLAEISRRIVHQYHDSMSVTSSRGLTYHAQVMAMDAELDQMIHDIPSSFHLDIYELTQDLTTSGIFVQAYMLNSIIYTQRCKLHLGYFAARPNNNPAYASSRETYLKAARQIIRAEAQLERAQHIFVLTRLRLSGVLHGVFMAAIMLLMGSCVNGTASQQDEICRGEAAEALRIIEDARGHSAAAVNLHKSLTQVLAKHRAQQQQQQQQPSYRRPPHYN